MPQLTGEQATAAWLTGMKTNATLLQDNIATLRAVNDGEIDGGIINHYYWFRDQAKTKEISANTALHYFRNEDPGAFISISGGGVLESSKKKDQAQQFLKFVTGKAGQEVLEKGTSFRVPGGQRRAANPALPGAGHPAGTEGRPVHAGRRQGHRPDDQGGLAQVVSTQTDRPTAGPRLSRPAGAAAERGYRPAGRGDASCRWAMSPGR